MSVHTTADEKLQETREYINKASQSLYDFLNPSIWGYNEYDDEFIIKMHQIRIDLLNLKAKI